MREPGTDLYFIQFQIELLGHGGSEVQKIDDVRTQERLRYPVSHEVVGRDHDVGAGCAQMLFRVFFASTSNDLQFRIQRFAPSARCRG